MARSFNGTSDYLVSASALSALASKSRIAVSFWYSGVYADDDDILLETSTNSNSNAGCFKVIANESASGQLQWDHYTTVKAAGRCPEPSNSTWHHILIQANTAATSNEVESIHLDGSSQTLDREDGNGTGTFTSQTLYVMCRAGTALFADGYLADLCIWAPSSAISGTDISDLAGGRRAHTVRNSEILYHWPLAGTTSPEPANIGAIALTVTGATQVADPPALDGMGTTVTAVAPGTVTAAGVAPDVGAALTITATTHLT